MTGRGRRVRLMTMGCFPNLVYKIHGVATVREMKRRMIERMKKMGR